MSKKCQGEGCRKIITKGNFCGKCYSRRWRKKNLERSTYLNLKANSKRRNKEFDLSYEDFLEFARRTNYLAGKGIHKDSLHIDRVIEELGYTKNNIRAIPNQENVRKYLRYRYNYEERKMVFEFKVLKFNLTDCTINEYPF